MQHATHEDANGSKHVPPLLANGGKAVIVGVRSTNIPDEYRENPLFEFWDSTDPASHNRKLPANTRAVILTRFLPHDISTRLIAEARKRPNVTLFNGYHSTGQLKQTLDDLVGVGAPTKEERAERKIAKHGAIARLAEQADLSLSGIDEARRLFEVAKQSGISTTVNSLAQAITQRRRKLRATGVPASILPKKSPTATLLQVFDDVIAGLQVARETIVAIAKKNDDLEARYEKLRATLEGKES